MLKALIMNIFILTVVTLSLQYCNERRIIEQKYSNRFTTEHQNNCIFRHWRPQFWQRSFWPVIWNGLRPQQDPRANCFPLMQQPPFYSRNRKFTIMNEFSKLKIYYNEYQDNNCFIQTLTRPQFWQRLFWPVIWKGLRSQQEGQLYIFLTMQQLSILEIM